MNTSRNSLLCRLVHRSCLCVGFICIGLAMIGSAAAQDIWTGGGSDANWQTGGNWLSGVAPAAGDSLTFTGATQLGNTNNFLAGMTFDGLTFASPAGAFVLNGKAINLNGNITNKQVVTEQTINLPMTLATTPRVDVVENGTLTIDGILSGSGGVTKTSGGLLNLNGANTFVGPVTVDGGAVAIGSDGNLGAVPGSATPGSIVLNGGALEATTSLTLNANRGIALGSAGGGFGILTVNGGHTLTYGGVIANNGGSGTFVKNGYGGLSLSGQNTYSGATSNRVGTLTLDFTQTGSPANNIIPAASDLTLGGENAGIGGENEAELDLVGQTNAVNSQSFNSTHLTFAGSIIHATSGTGGAMNLHLGALSHDAGGALQILPASIVSGGAGNITTTSGNINGMLGGYATISDGTTYSANGYHVYYSTNFAAVDGSGNIVNFNNYFTWASGNLNGQVTVASNLLFAPTGPSVITVDNANANSLTEVNTINISTAEASGTGGGSDYYGIYIGQGNTLRLGRYGGILKTDRSEDVITIGGVDGSVQTGSGTSGSGDIGTLTAGGADNTPGEIVMTSDAHDESHGTTIFECKITDNGTGKVSFVKMGPGSIKLDGHNTFSGGLYLLQGRVQTEAHEINNTNLDGSLATGVGLGPVYVLPGSYFFGDAVYTNDFYVAGSGTAAEPLGCIRAGTYDSPIHLIGDAILGGGTFDGPITGPFSLGLCMPLVTHGDVHLGNQGNDWTGDTVMHAEDHSGNNYEHVYNDTNEVIPNGFGKGNVIMEPGGGRSTSYITWDLNGFNETVNGLSSSGNHEEDCIITNGAGTGTSSTLTVGDNDQSGSFDGLIQDGGSAGGTLGLTKIGAGVETLTRSNSYTGDTIVSDGTLALTGNGSIAGSGTITVQSGGTFDVTGETNFSTPNNLSLNGGVFKVSSGAVVGTLNMNGGHVRISGVSAMADVAAATLSLSGTTNYIDLTSVGLISGYPVEFPVIQYSGAVAGTFNFGLGQLPSATTTGYVTNNTANGTIDVVLLTGPSTLTWTAANGNSWDIATTTNWLAFGTTPSVYHEVDSVFFDDTAASGTVNIGQPVQPGFVEVTNNLLTYTFTGAGGIGGTASMIKDGTGTLILDNSGGIGFSGGFIISGGIVQVGNNDTGGSLPLAGGVEDDNSLVFDRADDLTVSSAISGTGAVTKDNANVLTLSGNNSYQGALNVAQGTLKAGSATALGATNGPTIVSSGATLDINGQSLGVEPVIASGSGVGGSGAIINSGPDNTTALNNVTLAGDTTFGGSGRWDIRGAGAQLSTSGNAYNLTKVGTNQVSIVGATVDGSLGDINVMSGTLSLETTTSGLGNPANTLTVAGGATLQLYQAANVLSKQIIFNGDGVATTLNCLSGTANQLSGSFTLNGSCLFDTHAGAQLTLSGSIAGGGSLLSFGGGTNVISSGTTGTYTGGTVVSNSALVVDGSVAGVVNVIGGATLSGNGTAGGDVTVQNASLSAGDGIGTLTVGGNLALSNSTVVLELSSSPGTGNDKVAVSGGLSLSGTNTLEIVPLSYMNVGDTYTLLTYGGTPLPSSASNNLQIASSAAGFAFSLVDPGTTPGSIQIKVLVAIGNDVWTGQLSPVWDTASTNWTRNSSPVSFNNGDFVTFDDSSAVTNVSISGALQVGNIMMNNNSETYHFAGAGSLTGSGGLSLSSGGGLVIANGGTNTFSGPITVSVGSLQVGDGSTNGNLGSGALTNNGSLVFDRSDAGLILSNIISGSGSLTNIGAGTVTLAGPNNYSGTMTVLSGTVRTLNNTALGNPVSSYTYVSNGATLDIGANTVNLGVEPVYVSGAGVGGDGAVINSSGSPNFSGPNIGQVTMGGDTTVGGSGRIDLRASSAGANDVTLYTDPLDSPYTLTKVGTNQFQIAGAQIDPGLGDIDVQGGIIGFQWQTEVPGLTESLGDPSYTLHLHPGTTMNLFDVSNTLDKVLVMDDSATVYDQHGSNVFIGPVTLNGSEIFNTAYPLTLTGNIGGGGSLVKIGVSELVLSTGSQTYTGNTYVNGGTLALLDVAALTDSPAIILSNATIDVTGRTDGTLNLGSAVNQTLAGAGSINGLLVENPGSTVNPGNGVAPSVLTVSNGVTLNGNVIMDLNQSAGAVTNDEIIAPDIFSASGTITVVNLGPDLITGARFQLFSVPVSGSPTVNLPAHNAANTIAYTWANNIATDGSITLTSGASGVNTNPTNIVVSVNGGSLTLSWPADHLGWTLETNAVGLAAANAWFPYPGSDTRTNEVITFDRSRTNVFFRLTYTP